MSVTKRSVCPFDCPDTCGLLVEVEGGRAVAVKGDPEHPYTRGSLCPKMLHYEKSVHSPLRLTTPLKRTGAKGSGEFAPISWDEAVAAIAGRWKEIIATHGAEAILPYSYAGTMGVVQRNAGHPFFHRLGASRLDRTICSPAKGAGWQAVMGKTPTPHPDSAGKSDLLILWGINAAATSIHFLNAVREVKQRGGEVWLIDTYRTPTAAAADRTILVRPGSDAALALGIMHVLAREGLVNEPFVAESVLGYREFRREVLGTFTLDEASRLTGLPVATIEELARRYAAAKAPFIRIGSGLSRYGNGAMTVRCIACLPALVGAWEREGGGAFPDTSTGGAFAMEHVLREDFVTTPTRIVNMNRLGEALNTLNNPPVMSLYVYHSNPAAVTPDQNAVLRGLSRDDLFTVVHERFLTDTARYADIVLPATSSLEHSDIYRAYGTYCIQRARAAVDPVGESKSNWEVFSLLAKALGFEEEPFTLTADELIDRLLALPSPMREGIDTRALAEGKGVELTVNRDGGYLTRSGKIEILNRSLPEPLPCYLPTHEEEGKLPFRLMTAPNPFALNATFYDQPDLREKQGGMRLQMNPSDADARGLKHGERVVAFNELGEVPFFLDATDRVPPGVVVAEGVWWIAHAPGNRSVNALTSQRLTDQGGGSTFYDNRVDVRPE
ncbi:molybdopterin oxidoreductase family protein [Geomonas sp. Red32]|uniref:molybdopterin oxidoreductase family protein n=1 Tax=Geomonas sp. Red32 TaxID=2912856 RepID=UPI00202CFCD9|nr:molybdopterin oxidoreductase family protein [Geomonas sp. Red32]MCM0079992.1 molybdopterin oxidoreductase family protein [Geomonas sp. Red32]